MKARRLNPYERALKNPNSRALAIRAKCWDCEGRGADPGWQQRVRTCVVEDCPLYHVRPYQPERSGEPFRDPEIEPEGVGTGGRELGLGRALGRPPTDTERKLEGVPHAGMGGAR